MLAKIYWYIWLAIVAVAGIFQATGNMTTMAIVVFGFIAFGMTFMGMMGVLPWMISHPVASEPFPTEENERIMPAGVVSLPQGAHSVRV